MSYDGKRPVTLEDLLRLKRAERPAPEFWQQFDRELRAKQLAALVRKKPWWRELPRSFSGLARYRLPLGAAAVLALTFVTVKDFSSGPDTSVDSDDPSVPAPTSAVASVATAPRVEIERPETTEMAGPQQSVPAGIHGPGDQAVAVDSMTPATSAPIIPLVVGTGDPTPAQSEDTPSARYIAANLAAVKAAEASGVARGLLGGARTFENRAVATRTVAVEPLQQMTHPSQVRLARYRSPLVATVADESEDRTGERIARRISGDRLYDHIGRIGARGDSVSWKF